MASDGDWGHLVEHDSDMAEAWDSFSRLPDVGENASLDAFCERKNISIEALVRLGAKLSDAGVLAFAFPGGIKYRDMVTGRRWSYLDSDWRAMKIVRHGAEPSHRVIIAEGETDAARLTMVYDADVAVMPAGARYFPAAYADQLRDYAIVLVGLDVDEAGEAGAAKVMEHLTNAMRFAPPANDWCEATEFPPLPDELERRPEAQLLVSAGDLWDLEMPEIASWFEHALLPIGGSLILHGWAKSFKSFQALDLMAALAQGRDWCGFEPTEEPTRVAVVQFEIPPVYYRERLKAIREHAVDADLFDANFFTWTPMQRPRIRVGDDKSESEMIRELVDNGIQAVLFDPVRRVMGTLNMNAEDEVRRLLGFYERIQDEGITVVTCHHDGKTAARGGGGDPIGMTGSGAFAGDFDSIVSVSVPKGDTIDSPRRNLNFLMRNAPSVGARGMTMQDDGHIIYSLEPHGPGEEEDDSSHDLPVI